MCNGVMLQYEKCSALDHDEISVHDLDDPATLRRLPVTTTTFKIQILPSLSSENILRECGVRCRPQGPLGDTLHSMVASLMNVSLKHNHSDHPSIHLVQLFE